MTNLKTGNIETSKSEKNVDISGPVVSVRENSLSMRRESFS